MSIRYLLRAVYLSCWLLPAVLCCGGCGGSNGTASAFNTPSSTPSATLPGQFSATQGGSGWSYYSASPGQNNYQPLTWGTAPASTPYQLRAGWQQASAPDLLIANGVLHPGTGADAVLAWQGAGAGVATINVTLTSLVTAANNTGVALSIWQNATQIGGPNVIGDQSGQSPTTSVTHLLQAGDIVYVRISAQQDATPDWFGYQVVITGPAVSGL